MEEAREPGERAQREILTNRRQLTTFSLWARISGLAFMVRDYTKELSHWEISDRYNTVEYEMSWIQNDWRLTRQFILPEKGGALTRW